MSDTQTNPFDDENLAFLVLVNNQTQYSLWPDITAVPPGWRVVLGPESRSHCVQWLEQNWQDIRPRALHA
ncbi:Enterobactin biosynthesis protein YbdZ [Andreprevotia sp. IGB-42]|uniref:MbtH family protein n=1 Tax=Andreprevotia sp. IGB-42 TaxID=2497473 RepID=UPI00135B5085|nr:MbtH family protein [Andreprevotia sp. IGB-42]KAF0812622.1 Enterobactin biosynthesis protein YbdZ [Andreprevotia sp. IGB-42]